MRNPVLMQFAAISGPNWSMVASTLPSFTSFWMAGMLSNPTTCTLPDFPAASSAFTTPSAIESFAAMMPCTSGCEVKRLVTSVLASSVSQCAVRETSTLSPPSLAAFSNPAFRILALSAPGLPSMMKTLPPLPSFFASSLPAR